MQSDYTFRRTKFLRLVNLKVYNKAVLNGLRTNRNKSLKIKSIWGYVAINLQKIY